MCSVLIGIVILAIDRETERQKDGEMEGRFVSYLSVSPSLRLSVSPSLWRNSNRHRASGMAVTKSKMTRGIRRRSAIRDALSSPTINTPRRIANRLNRAESIESETDAATPAAILLVPFA